ncbi:MAG: SAM-dependent methyltransferase [Pseudonocardiaceae bacterium]
MTERPKWVPESVADTVPSPARMYDYLLGGGHNFAADREMVDKLGAITSLIVHVAMHNRAFLRRAVQTLVASGVRQFLDLGSGIPTVGNVHEIAQQADPQARVVYVDNDPVAVSHSELVLEGNDRATAILADMRDPAAILTHPKTRRLLDFDAPIGLLIVAMFHYITDSDDPMGLLARYREALAPGSHLVMSHMCTELNPAGVASVVTLMNSGPNPVHPRPRAEIADLFTGYQVLEPGLVPTPLWRPDAGCDAGDDAGDDVMLAGLGIKL